MPISVKCQCGRTLKIDEKHRGKKAKCPECGNLVLVQETGVQAGSSRKSGSASSLDFDEPESRQPVKRPAKSNKMLFLAGGGCAALLLLMCCLTGIGGGVWYFFFTGPEPDLIYVHDGCAGFMSFRVADLWKNSTIKDQAKDVKDKIAEVESKFGLKTEDVERLTVVVRSIDVDAKDLKDVAFVVRTSKPMDRKKIIGALTGKDFDMKHKESKHDGKTIDVFDAGGADSSAACFVTDRIVVVAEKESILKDVLTQSKKPPKNPAIVRGVAMAGAGKHQVVMAFELKKSIMDKLDVPPGVEVASVLKANGFILAAAVASDVSGELVLTFDSKDTAASAKIQVDGLVSFGRLFAGPQAPPPLKKTLDSIKVEQSGSDVVVKAKTDLDPKMFGNIPGFGGGGIGGGAKQMQSSNNLKQIGLAMHNFHDQYKGLPNHAIVHPQTGQPLLSWRVAILPFIEQDPLYRQIKLNEAWDSPANQKFWKQMPSVYVMPGKPNDGRTYYQVFHGPSSAFPKLNRKPIGNGALGEIRLPGITDGPSNTIFVVEAANSVNWMQPDDITFDQGAPGPVSRLGNHWGNNTVQVLMGDGFVQPMRRNMTAKTLAALITRNGNEPLNPKDWEP